MKLYPKHHGHEEDRGFTAEEIRRGVPLLYADVICKVCGKIQSLAMAGSSDAGRCISCGGETA